MLEIDLEDQEFIVVAPGSHNQSTNYTDYNASFTLCHPHMWPRKTIDVAAMMSTVECIQSP